MACLDRRSYLRGRRARPARPQRPPAGADRRKPAPHQGPTGRTQGLSEDAVDMTLRLDNACGVDHMPTAVTADENPIIGSWFGIDRAPQMMPGRVRQNASLPRARSTRNGGRDQIGILGDLKSECLGEIIGIRTKVACAKLYDRKTPITAADLLNDRVIPFFDSHDVKLLRVLTDRGSEYCGNPERHEYELYLAVEDIDHSRTKTKSP